MASTRFKGRSYAVAAIALATLATAGCAKYQPRPISPEQSLEDFEARRLDAPELGEFLEAHQVAAQWPPVRWDLHSLTLAALFYNPDLDVARAQWAVASGGVIAAGGRANPLVIAGTAYNSTTDAALISPWFPSVVLELPLDIANKRGIRINQAEQLSEAARLNILTAAWKVREPGLEEHKYYVRGVGLVLEDEGRTRVELIEVTTDAQGE
ncbi:MAG: hypothetical protein Q8W45_09655 [Candidatus Palauibacterales bacterium]|nr:hypothetical protein [Candidatus Palauibacterales bacterium]MDP2483536.1 hypothetical protein [Candidatus Palauibacterales bacterium]